MAFDALVIISRIGSACDRFANKIRKYFQLSFQNSFRLRQGTLFYDGNFRRLDDIKCIFYYYYFSDGDFSEVAAVAYNL